MIQFLQRQHLSQSTRLRISAFTLFYFAQGIPIGLISVALPAWLAGQEFGAEEIASLVAITGLPWGFKLIAGPFMDRFAFLPMGFRRPWVMFAQGGLALAMLLMSTVSDPSSQFWLMVWIGFTINCFGALQDVAVDGMAIDLLPEDERGRANAFMGFGQVAGFSVFGALNGWLLVTFGLPVTALISALVIAAIFAFIALVREREGERLLPWTPGEASHREIPPARSFLSLFKDLFKVLFLPMSLILTAAEWVSRMGAGVGLTIYPLIGVQELGYSSEIYALWMSITSAIGAFVGVFFGPLVDRYGTKPLMMGGFALTAITAATFALAQPVWDSDTFVIVMLMSSNIASQMVFVAVLAGFMMICWNQVAASQFSVYMSLANLARSVGAGLYGMVAADLTYIQALYVIAGLNALSMILLFFFNLDSHKSRIARLTAEHA